VHRQGERELLSITLDWLALTFTGVNRDEITFIDAYCMHPTILAATPRNGYTSAQTDACGVQLLWNDDRPEMGYHAVFAGSALRNLQQLRGIHMETLLRDAVYSEGHISRLDIAKDFVGESVNYQAIYQSLEQNANVGLARKYGKIESNDGGFTIYVGSRQSEKFIRIYNKAAEGKLQGELWSRFELETKGMVARSLAHSICASDNWAKQFDGLVLGMLDLPHCDEYQKFFQPGILAVGLPRIEKTSDTERWIETQVIPAVCRHFAKNKHSQAVQRLIDALLYIAQHPE
jgi:hypothetical protein